MTTLPGSDGAYEPLVGLKILEIASSGAGSYAGTVLADLGADVVRIDSAMGLYARTDVREELQKYFSRNKRTVEMGEIPDLLAGWHPDVVIVDRRLEDAVDDLVETVLRSVGDGPVVAEATEVPGHRPTASSLLTGATAAANWSIGRPDREPLTLPADYSDYLAGLHLAGAILADDIRFEGAKATRLEVGAADVLAYLVSMIGANFVPYGRQWRRDGARITESGGCYPGAIFRASDGDVAIVCRQPKEWHGLIAAMGSPAWTNEPRFDDPRVIAKLHADEADSYLGPWIAGLTCAELERLGQENGFPVAPVRKVGENLAEPQFLGRRFFGYLDERESLLVPGRPYEVTTEEAGEHRRRVPVRNPAGVPHRPLAGLRVLDLTWVWSGPMVTSVLADLGARVVKVENDAHPDPVRIRGRAIRDGAPVAGPDIEGSPFFNQQGHDKHSVKIDLASEAGRETIIRLAADCDLVVENMRPGVLDRHGLGWGELSSVNPDLVYVSMSTMGSKGPRSQMRGYGVVMSGFAGLEQLIGYPDQTVGAFNLAMSDATAASHALVALLAALRRAQGGHGGAWIDLSQIEATIALLIEPILEAQIHGEAVVPGNTHSTFHPHGTYASSEEDRWVCVATQTDQQRSRLRDLLQAQGEDLAPSPTREALEASLIAWIARTDRESAVRTLRAYRIPAAAVSTYEELTTSARFVDGGFASQVDHPYLMGQLVTGVPWRFDGVANRPRHGAPLLGEDDSLLAALDRDELANDSPQQS